jgi:uncharacterized protein (TIGR02246 family)
MTITLETLLAEKACRDLVVAAAAAVDLQDYNALVQLFTPDATLTRPDGVVLTGHQAIHAAYAARDPDRLTQHLVSNHVVEVAPDHTTAHSHCAILLWSGQRTSLLSAKGRLADVQQQVGEIADSLVLQADGWRIQTRVARFNWVRPG